MSAAVMPAGLGTWLREAFGPQHAAQWATSLVGMAAIGFAWLQLTSARETSYETFALNFWQRYNESRLEYPELATGDLPLTEMSREQRVRYEAFILNLALAGEAIMNTYPSSPEWRSSIEQHLAVHCRNLPAMFSPSELLTYDQPFRSSLMFVIASCGRAGRPGR